MSPADHIEVSRWRYAEPIAMTVSVSNDIPVHQHRFFELVYLLEGKAYHTFGGKERVISQGDYFILDPTGTHGYRPYENAPFRIVNCCFRAEFLDASCQNIEHFDALAAHPLLRTDTGRLRRPPTETVFRDDGRLQPLVEQMFAEYAAHRPGCTEIIRGLLIVCLVTLLRCADEEEPSHTANDLTRSIITYIETHAASHCTLEDAAAALNYSPPYLSRRFKLDTGMTFSAYRQKTRIDNACRLLANTDLSVEVIARSVGYTDMKHFHRLFRRARGMTPREYRMHQNHPFH